MADEKVAIMTDTNSGMSVEEGERLGVFVIPMPILINGNEYLEDVDIHIDNFFRILVDDKNDVKTSQPSAGILARQWKKILEEYDTIVYIPMSSGLSSSCQTAQLLAEDYNNRVYVVDNHRISVTMYQSIMDAITLRDLGYSAKKIADRLTKEAFQSSIYIMVDTLHFLKKGGRVTPSAAAMGSLLNIKPVLQIQGGELDTYQKCRGVIKAKNVMLQAIRDDFDNRFKSYVKKNQMVLRYSFAGISKEEELEWKRKIEETFPGFEIEGRGLSMSISTHIGPGAYAIACAKRVVE